MAKSRKKSAKKDAPAQKKKFPVKKLIAVVLVVVLLSSMVVFLVIITNRDNYTRALRGTTWVSQSARTASGDEVDIREVYNVKYSNYQGRLIFEGDSNKFELWLSPGDLEDGTHSGTYELKEDKITASFDEGTVTDFAVTRTDGAISRIDVNYDEYVVSFFKQ